MDMLIDRHARILTRLAIVKELTSDERSGGRAAVRSLVWLSSAASRPPVRWSCLTGGAAFSLKGPVEARTWGLITQPHTVMRPIRHRRPSLIPGAHQVSRKGDGTDYEGRCRGWGKVGWKIFAEVSGNKGLG